MVVRFLGLIRDGVEEYNGIGVKGRVVLGIDGFLSSFGYLYHGFNHY